MAEDPSDSPIAGLDPAWQARFDAGDADFEAVFRPTQGLGPVYIRHSCASCHADDARGPGSVQKMVMVDATGQPLADQSALPFGHTVRPLTAGTEVSAVTAPEIEGVLVSTRAAPAVFGRGYLEAIRDDEIERVEAEQAARDDGVSGRINRVPWQSATNPEAVFHGYVAGDSGMIGRFGLKARIATVDDFAADAYQGDMGITSPLRPEELPNPSELVDDALPGVDIDLDTVNLVADYVRLLAIPERASLKSEGKEQFAAAGCAVCHVPVLRTRTDHPVEQLRDVDAPVFTDLLLHDMGPAFSDGLVEFDAAPSEWRTAPLIGLRHMRNYLHDGRAATVEEAIVLHGGEGSEARASVEAFKSMSGDDRAALLAYVSQL